MPLKFLLKAIRRNVGALNYVTMGKFFLLVISHIKGRGDHIEDNTCY
jgi:hypothetical protein